MQQGTTILIVDDEKIIRDVVTLLLRRAGYRVLSAASGPEALDLVRATGELIELAVLDLVMPNLGGVRLLSRLRGIQPGMRALFISGYDTPLGLPNSAAFLSKPFTAAELLRAVGDTGRRAIAQTA
ncbi:MAG: response regulator receiver protein [Candidatus Solibacter sp.]|nr:response regulator receiver protein [Candidatus Solibacter sp.]